MCRGKISYTRAVKSQVRPEEGNLAPLLNFLCYSGHLVVFFCFLSWKPLGSQREPHMPLTPSTRQRIRVRAGASEGTLHFFHRSPSVIAP